MFFKNGHRNIAILHDPTEMGQNPFPFESVQNSVPQEIHRNDVVLPSSLGHKDGMATRSLTLFCSLSLSCSLPLLLLFSLSFSGHLPLGNSHHSQRKHKVALSNRTHGKRSETSSQQHQSLEAGVMWLQIDWQFQVLMLLAELIPSKI